MCLFPIKAFLYTDIETGLRSVRFRKSGNAPFEELSLPCGKCVECLMSYSNEWALRCVLEASLYRDNCMLTLTYRDNPVTLIKRDYQLFLKRLREALSPLKIRYFGCGEYGARGQRPHFHIIIFGWKPDDLDFFL